MRTDLLPPTKVASDGPESIQLRPSRLADFVGQPKVTEGLKIAVRAALGRREPLDHVLFHGPPGLGKTTLALLLAEEMGVGIKITAAPVLEKPGDLVQLLTAQKPGDILFIDEIHRLRPQLEEFLYPAMEDFRADIRLGEGERAQTIALSLAPFTLVGATTRLGLLTPPMRARFGLSYRLAYYSEEELGAIVRRSAEVLGVELSEEGTYEIVRRSRGTPRVTNRLLRRVRDYAEVRAGGCISGAVARKAFALLEVDEEGLDAGDRRLLEVMMAHFGGGPVGLSTLAVALGEDANTIEDVIEPFLIQRGYLARTPRGRIMTDKARRRFGR